MATINENEVAKNFTTKEKRMEELNARLFDYETYDFIDVCRAIHWENNGMEFPMAFFFELEDMDKEEFKDEYNLEYSDIVAAVFYGKINSINDYFILKDNGYMLYLVSVTWKQIENELYDYIEDVSEWLMKNYDCGNVIDRLYNDDKELLQEWFDNE